MSVNPGSTDYRKKMEAVGNTGVGAARAGARAAATAGTTRSTNVHTQARAARQAQFPQPSSAAEVQQKAAEWFRLLDGKNGDLHITEQEFTNAAVREYTTNGNKLPEGYISIGEYLGALTEKFRAHAGDDQKMNIDEYTAYLNSELPAETSTTPTDSEPGRPKP